MLGIHPRVVEHINNSCVFFVPKKTGIPFVPKVAMKDHEGGMGMFMFQLLFYCQPGLIESYPI